MKSENGEHESASYVFFFFKPPPEKKTRWEEVNEEEDGTFSFWANSCHLVKVEKRLSALRRVTDVNSEPHGSLVRLQTSSGDQQAGALHVHVIM